MSFFGSDRGLALPPVIKNIIIINAVIFLLQWLPLGLADFMQQNLALYSIKSELFKPHQLITHMFMHANFTHIFFNMFAVFMFGRILEQIWGSKKMLIFYTVTGLGAAAIHLTVNYFQMNHMIELASSFYNSPDYLSFSSFVKKYAHGRESAELVNFMQEWFYKPDDLSFVPQAKEVVRFLVTDNINIPTVGASGANTPLTI